MDINTAWWGWALFLGGLVFVLGRQRWRRRQLRRRFARACAAEKSAPRFAQRMGYRVLGTQVSQGFPVWVDGVRTTVSVRADLLLKKGRKLFVGEVKTGEKAPKLSTASTRRQMFEYVHAFDADGAVLFDMENERVQQVCFKRERGPVFSFAVIVILVASAAVAGWFVRDGFFGTWP